MTLKHYCVLLFLRNNKHKSVLVLVCILLFILQFTLFALKQKDVRIYCLHPDGISASHKTKRVSNLQKGGSKVNYSYTNTDLLVQQYLNRIQSPIYEVDDVNPYSHVLSTIKARLKKGLMLMNHDHYNGSKPWEIFLKNINQNYLYDPDDPNLIGLLKDLHTREITKIEMNKGSTHLVFRVTFDNGGLGVYKITRTPKDQDVDSNLFYTRELERSHAEIAAYYLDQLLGFYRVPPIISRNINITEVIGQVATFDIRNTIHRSPGGNLCFFGKCFNYCSMENPVCGHPDIIEGAMSIFLTGIKLAAKKALWSRIIPDPPTFRKNKWELVESFCEVDVKKDRRVPQRQLLNYVDLAVFDFLTGNMDRHDIDSLEEFGLDTFFIHLDNGRGFGKSKYDCMSCLAPVRQCCLIRLSTLAKLVKLYIGPDSLSQVLRTFLRKDPSYPVLWEPHLDALDRRLGKLLGVVSDCVIVKGIAWEDVVIDDGLP